MSYLSWYIANSYYSGEFMAGRLDGNRMQYSENKLKEAEQDIYKTIRVSNNDIDKALNNLVSFDRKSFNIGV